MGGYLTLPAGRELAAETEVRRSRFLSVVTRVGDESAARVVIASRRSAYPDARHHCSAFILGPDPRIERSNDDGEPSGTAGAPMLQVLRRAGLSDVVAVVTRYFGGTLLGTGGLARAYADAVQAALDSDNQRVRREPVETFALAVPHGDAGRVEAGLRAAALDSEDLQVLGTSYEDTAVLQLAAGPISAENLPEVIAGLTAGALTATSTGHAWIDLPV